MPSPSLLTRGDFHSADAPCLQPVQLMVSSRRASCNFASARM